MAARRREAKRRNWPANLNQNGAGYFYWRDPKTKKDYGIGRDQAKAFQEARAANAKIAVRDTELSLVDRISKPEGKTLAEWAPDYETAYEKTRQPTVATMRTVKAGVRAVLSAPFSSKQLQAIQTKEVAAFIADAAEKRGAQMAVLIRKTLSDMFREAETVGLIENGKNPVTVTRKPVVEVGRSRLTLDQFQAIYAKAKEGAPWMASALELALLTAQRREDISTMAFVDVRDGFLFVTQAKTQMKLRIPMVLKLDVLGFSLEETVKRCRDMVGAKTVLHHTRRSTLANPGDQISTHLLSTTFAALRKKAEIEWEAGKTPATFHELRSLAARLYTAQHGPDFAQALLGHKSASTTDMYRDTRGAEWVEVKIAS